MFYLLQFDNYESKEVKQLRYDLAGTKEQSLLPNAWYIRIPELAHDKLILWIDEPEELVVLKNRPGVKSLSKLFITASPRDPDWSWDDEYLKRLFLPFMA
jgi:hypothetical protein